MTRRRQPGFTRGERAASLTRATRHVLNLSLLERDTLAMTQTPKPNGESGYGWTYANCESIHNQNEGAGSGRLAVLLIIAGGIIFAALIGVIVSLGETFARHYFPEFLAFLSLLAVATFFLFRFIWREQRAGRAPYYKSHI